MKLRNKKTGEIWDIGKVLTNDYPSYDTLEQITEDFEDYNPAEPLVEGRSQRAVLRAAARLSGMNVATVKRSDIAEIVIFDFGSQCRVELRDRGIKVKNRGAYTIAELCGREEE